MDISTTELRADVLTAKMPLSDSINRAKSPASKPGRHHGFSLSFDDSGWPTVPTLKTIGGADRFCISAGAAIVGASLDAESMAADPVLLSVIADSDIYVSFSDLGILANDTKDYQVSIAINYAAPSVNNLTGLVSNIGTQSPIIRVVEKSVGSMLGSVGLVIGYFNRAAGMIWDSPDMIFGNKAVSSDSADVELSTSFNGCSTIGDTIRARIMESLGNLEKHIRVSGIRSPFGADYISSDIMPLSDIASEVAQSIADVNSWNAPVDWFAPGAADEVATAGVYRDVSRFEVFDSYFEKDVQLAFHRTPGHARAFQSLFHGDESGTFYDEDYIGGLVDVGAREFVFDGKGTVFNGDLSIDLVLDFVGKPHDCQYRVYFRNLQVKGNLRIKYGPSVPGLAGAACAIVEYDNVNVLGAINDMQPWPRIALTSAQGTDAVSNGFTALLGVIEGTKLVSMNNGGRNVNFIGWSTVGPAVLSNWRNDRMSSPGLFRSNGNMLLHYLHSFDDDSAGSGVWGMDNPWLADGVDGTFIIKNSTVPSAVLSGVDGTAALRDVEGPRVRLQNCKYLVTGASTYFAYLDSPTFRPAGDGIFTLEEFNFTQAWKDLRFFRDIITARHVKSDLDTIAGQDLQAVRDVVVGRNLAVAADISSVGTGINLGGIYKTRLGSDSEYRAELFKLYGYTQSRSDFAVLGASRPVVNSELGQTRIALSSTMHYAGARAVDLGYLGTDGGGVRRLALALSAIVDGVNTLHNLYSGIVIDNAYYRFDPFINRYAHGGKFDSIDAIGDAYAAFHAVLATGPSAYCRLILPVGTTAWQLFGTIEAVI